MAQWETCMPYKHEDLNLDPGTTKSQALWCMLITPVLVRQAQEHRHPEAHWAASLAEMWSLKFSERPESEK